MKGLPLIVIGVIGLVAGAVAGGAVGVFEDTKTETATTVVTQEKTKTRTVRRGRSGGGGAAKTVTRIRTVTAPQRYTAPGEAPASGGKTTVKGTRTLTGKDTKQFGTLEVGQTSILEWTNSGAVFSVISQTQLHVSSSKKKGSVTIYKGSYPDFRVAAIGRWKVTIRPR